MRRIMVEVPITDDEIIEMFNAACRDGRSPNVAVAEALGVRPQTAAALMCRLRKERPDDVLNGNVAKRREECPTCGATVSGWKRVPSPPLPPK